MNRNLRTSLKKIPFAVPVVRWLRRALTPKYLHFSHNRVRYQVVNHRFWQRFATGHWEPFTHKLYQQNIDHNTAYFDLGCWLGPTLFYAAQAGAKSLFALEANPETFQIVSQNCALNRAVLPPYQLKNACLHSRDGDTVSFGMSPERVGDTSSCSVRGDDFTVPTIRLESLFQELRPLVADKNFIKIDIEGFEEVIIADIAGLHRYVPGATIYLSMHPGFWQDPAGVAEQFLDLYQHYTVTDGDDQPLAPDTLKDMMLWQGSGRPAWSTHNGNFFEITLRAK